MKQLTEQQIHDNWLKLRGIINDTFEGERLEKLNALYDHFEDRMVVAPASAKEHYHNACVGVYEAHVIHKVEMYQQLVQTPMFRFLPFLTYQQTLEYDVVI